MNKKILISFILLLAASIVGSILFFTNKERLTKNNSTEKNETTINYNNNQYGFSFALPQGWKNYSIVINNWEGSTTSPKGEISIERGPLILIRNPKWTEQNPYQDIPIMIFTLKQWNSLQSDKFHIGAAPINPSELGRNAGYVFALPARYNFAFINGWEEVQTILDTHTLRTY